MPLPEIIDEKQPARVYGKILALIPVSVLLLDERLRVVYANLNFYAKSHKAPRMVLGQELSRVFPQELLAKAELERKGREVFSSGTPVEGGRIALRAPGIGHRAYFFSLMPMFTARTKKKRVLLLMEDVTQQENMAREIRRAERHLASVVESAGELILSTDHEGTIQTCNSAVERITGYEREEVVGKPLSFLWPECEKRLHVHNSKKSKERANRANRAIRDREARSDAANQERSRGPRAVDIFAHP